MLILTRRMGEKLIIGDDIMVSVLGKKGGQIRVGIEAPREVAVHREEIYRRIKKDKTDRENLEAIDTDTDTDTDTDADTDSGIDSYTQTDKANSTVDKAAGGSDIRKCSAW